MIPRSRHSMTWAARTLYILCYARLWFAMRLLYIVFILSIAALLWAAFAIARIVRGHGQTAEGTALSLRGDPPDDARS